MKKMILSTLLLSSLSVFPLTTYAEEIENSEIAQSSNSLVSIRPHMWASQTVTVSRSYYGYNSSASIPLYIYYSTRYQDGNLKLISQRWNSYYGRWDCTYRGTISGYI
jgi:hypothetical protein